jgi:plasmid stabilization system protein ParE
MTEYRLAPAAERDFEKVWTYTARHWGVGQADQYIDIISTGFQELAQQPQQIDFSKRQQPPNPYRPFNQYCAFTYAVIGSCKRSCG